MTAFFLMFEHNLVQTGSTILRRIIPSNYRVARKTIKGHFNNNDVTNRKTAIWLDLYGAANLK